MSAARLASAAFFSEIKWVHETIVAHALEFGNDKGRRGGARRAAFGFHGDRYRGSVRR